MTLGANGHQQHDVNESRRRAWWWRPHPAGRVGAWGGWGAWERGARVARRRAAVCSLAPRTMVATRSLTSLALLALLAAAAAAPPSPARALRLRRQLADDDTLQPIEVRPCACAHDLTHTLLADNTTCAIYVNLNKQNNNDVALVCE